MTLTNDELIRALAVLTAAWRECRDEYGPADAGAYTAEDDEDEKPTVLLSLELVAAEVANRSRGIVGQSLTE